MAQVPKKRRRVSPLRRFGLFCYGLLVVLSLAVIVLFCAYHLLSKEPEMAGPVHTPTAPGVSGSSGDLERREHAYTFLLVAKDQVGVNADTMIVCTYDTEAQTVGMVSVPRDTLVESGKLNSVYQKGIETLRDTISDLLGVPIDFYVGINMEGLKVLVDDARRREEFLLEPGSDALLIESGEWAEEYDFLPGTVVMVIASQPYMESDYLRDYSAYIEWKSSH